ncbi:hypothetical protein HDA36_004220 [Nocardiopsis composta]|uniref:MFS transporter n=1 Tax=Nocardiopsis composta TaxID=157465 RepID=A0A7W8QR71_9ACTN|nr:hypothetical protein [Nocardiopsis composta]
MSSTTAYSAERPGPAGRPPFRAWSAVVSVMMGIFAIVTAEILPIGLLTSIGADFTVSDGMAGLTMAMPGPVAAVSAPLATAVAARIDRRLMPCAFILLPAAAFAALGLPAVAVFAALLSALPVLPPECATPDARARRHAAEHRHPLRAGRGVPRGVGPPRGGALGRSRALIGGWVSRPLRRPRRSPRRCRPG